MLQRFMSHGFVAIWLAVVLEDVGVPLPVPADVLAILAGAAAAHSLVQLGQRWLLLVLASTLGASGLYALVRHGGRPLIARVGPYVHLAPERLAQAEARLQAAGWRRLALGCGLPGLRYVTRIACGLLGVPYRRFLTAHLAGSAVYMAVFVGVGAGFGPHVAGPLHRLHHALRLPLVLGLVLSVGVGWCGYQVWAGRDGRTVGHR